MKNFFTLFFVFFVISGFNAQSQTLTSIDPDTVTQGQTVTCTIMGSSTHFYAVTGAGNITIRQGVSSIPATSFTVNSDTQLTATFTFGFTISGLCNIRVVNPTDGTMNKTGCFYINVGTPPPPAQILKIDPDTVFSGTKVTIEFFGRGTTFTSITSNTWIQLRQTPSNINSDSFTIIHDSDLIAYFTIPGTATGKYDARVRIGTWITLAQALTVLVNPNGPQIISISPDSAYRSTKAVVTINTKNTHYSTSAPACNLFLAPTTINADSTKALNDTLVTAYFTIPGTATISNLWDIRVQNTTDGIVTKVDGFRILANPFAPAIISTENDSAFQGEKLWVTVFCKFTHYSTSKPNVSLFRMATNIIADSVVVLYDSVVNAHFNITAGAATGLWSVRCQNTTDGNLTLNNRFTIYASPFSPTLIMVDPDSAYQGQSVWVNVNGRNTHFTTSKPNVFIYRGPNNVAADSLKIINDTILNAHFSLAKNLQTGLYGVRVQSTTDGNLQLANSFTVLLSPFAPKLLSISPGTGEQGTTVAVTIKGRYTTFSSGINQVAIFQGFNTIMSTSDSVLDDSTLLSTFDIPLNASTQLMNIRVNDIADGNLTLNGVFLITPSPLGPHIVSIDPVKAQQGDQITMTINCTNTSLTVMPPNTRLFFGQGVQIFNDSQVVDNDTVVTAYFTIPGNATVGLWDVIVQSQVDGNMIFADGFEITALPGSPQLLTASPDSVEQGKPCVLIITSQGTNFTTGLTPQLRLIKTNWPNINADSFVAIDDTTLKGYFHIPDTASGYWTVFYRNNTDGSMSLVNAVKIYKVIIGLKDEFVFEGLKVWPNPAKSVIQYKFTLEKPTDVKIELMGINGEIISSPPVATLSAGDHQSAFDLTGLPGGIYLLKLTTSTQTTINRIIH